jgi:hypothetical protein
VVQQREALSELDQACSVMQADNTHLSQTLSEMQTTIENVERRSTAVAQQAAIEKVGCC